MYSKTTIMGRVGRDPEIRTMQNGNEVANLSVATSEFWKDRNTGEKKEKTEWHKVVVFNPHLVNVIRDFVRKGSLVLLEGQNQTRKWTDQSGSDNYTTEIVLQQFNGDLKLLPSGDKKPNDDYQRPSNNDYQQSTNMPSADNLDDEIPFR